MYIYIYIYIYVYMAGPAQAPAPVASHLLFGTHLKGATCSSHVSKAIMGPIQPKRPQGPSHPGNPEGLEGKGSYIPLMYAPSCYHHVFIS